MTYVLPRLAASLWANLPPWVSAGSALGALIFAITAVGIARRTFLMNTNAFRQQEAFTRRSQAALVSVWCGKENREPAGEFGVYLRNASDTPVYRANLTITSIDGKTKPTAIQLPVIPPNRFPVFHAVRLFRPADDPVGIAEPASDYRVDLRFTDATGCRWMRDKFGHLNELEHNLLIWASPETEKVVTPFTQDFLLSHGVTAICDATLIDAELEKHFLDAKEGPDILVGPHDWLGRLVEHQAIEPIVLAPVYKEALRDERWALDALSWQGDIYAFPSSLDTVALIRNNKLAPEVPGSIEELLRIGQVLLDSGTCTRPLALPVGANGDPYHIWPLFRSGGGWLFGRRADGSWNPHELGVDTPETIAAFERLSKLAQVGILRRDVDNTEALRLFESEQAPFLISTSGIVRRARARRLDVSVDPVPPFEGGEPAESLVSVYGFYIGRRGRNTVIARDLVPEYLTRPDVMHSFADLASVVPLAPTSQLDPAIAQFRALCQSGVQMPSFPQMRDVWQLLRAAELSLIAGTDAASLAAKLATDISALF